MSSVQAHAPPANVQVWPAPQAVSHTGVAALQVGATGTHAHAPLANVHVAPAPHPGAHTGVAALQVGLGEGVG